VTNTHFIFFSPLSHSRIREWLFFVLNCIAAENKALRAYCEQEGLTYRQDRTQVYGYSDISKKKKPVDFVQTIDNGGKSGIMKTGKDLSKYVGAPIVEKDNLHVREWYYANVHNIPNIIDKNLPFEQQVMQAYDLRNKYKREARVAMIDLETLDRLEKKRPIKSFDELLESKMKRKNMTREEALRDILETASKTNSEADDLFGL